MAMTVAEQYLLELINRARLDPAGEVARYGIGLNDGLNAGTIDTTVKQVLAPSAELEAAAVGHSLWMLQNGIFSHTGVGGSQPWDRAEDQRFIGWVGENIAFNSMGGGTTLSSMIEVQHKAFLASSVHREQLMTERWEEIGLGQESGKFTGVFGSMITEVFGDRTGYVYLTGVAYNDRDGDQFYSMGEGTRGVAFSIGQTGEATSDTGGYGFGVKATSAASVTGRVDQKAFSLTVDMSRGNVKLDVVNGNMLLTSGSVELGTGIHGLRLLGIDALNATGSRSANAMTGNNGANDLRGGDGDDRINGDAGNDRIWGDAGADLMWGSDGNDVMAGGAGGDSMHGDAGNDRISGGDNWDKLRGGTGADDFVFTGNFATDVVRDFSLREGDDLVLNDAIWGSRLSAADVVSKYARVVSGDVVFNFGNGEVIVLENVTTRTGLSAAIEIF